jgi:hypothetical protein
MELYEFHGRILGLRQKVYHSEPSGAGLLQSELQV